MTVSGYFQSYYRRNGIESPVFATLPIGKIRLQSLVRPNVIKTSAPLTTATPKHKTEKTPSPLMPSMTTGENL